MPPTPIPPSVPDGETSGGVAGVEKGFGGGAGTIVDLNIGVGRSITIIYKNDSGQTQQIVKNANASGHIILIAGGGGGGRGQMERIQLGANDANRHGGKGRNNIYTTNKDAGNGGAGNGNGGAGELTIQRLDL
jgi:hypothetical protein